VIRRPYEAVDGSVPVVLGPGAFPRHSYGTRDAARRTAPPIEAHVPDPYAREEFHRTPVVAAVAPGTTAGLGTGSCEPAPRALADRQAD